MTIKRSVPTTLLVRCPNADYAEGVKDGIVYTLECLLHECDVILRCSPTVIHDQDQQYRVRARFTVRSKQEGKAKGEWIKINSAYYEEKFNDSFDNDRDWKGLTDEDKCEIINETGRDDRGYVMALVEAKLKEKNHG